jgi:hypothetical protein
LVRIWFNQRQKGQVLGLDLFKEPVNLSGILNIMGMNHAQQIDRNLMLPQQVVSPYHLLMGGAPTLEDSVLIVQFLRTVQTETDSKLFVCKKLAPLFFKEGAVGLDSVGYSAIGRPMLALKGHNPAKVIDAQKGRLPTMPGKVDRWSGRGLDVLDDVPFQDILGHAELLTFWVEMLFFQVIAVVTAQVADGPNGLGENLKFSGSVAQSLVPYLATEPPSTTMV